MENMLNNLSIYGYIFLFLYSFGGGMVAIIAAGILSYSGKFDLTVCITIASVGNFIGSSLLFYLARYNKAQIMPYIKKHLRKFALAQISIKKYGSVIILIQKYIYGVKTLVPVAIGITKYDVKRFLFLNLIASIIWAISLGLISYFMGDFFIRVYQFASAKPSAFPLVILSIFALISLYFFKFSKKQ